MPMSCSIARRPQQLALARVAGVQARGGELVEQRRARARRRAAVCGGVDVVLRGEVEHARAAHVVEQRRVAVAGSARRTRPRAARPRSPRAPSKPPASSTRLHDERAREDEVGARGLDARDLAALGRRAARPARSTSSSSASRAITKPCTPNSGSPARAARRRRGCAPCRRCRRGGRRRCGQPRRARARSATCSRSALSCLAWPVRRRGGSARSSAPRPAATSRARARGAPATRTSCIEPPPRSSTAPSLSVVELTAAR